MSNCTAKKVQPVLPCSRMIRPSLTATMQGKFNAISLFSLYCDGCRYRIQANQWPLDPLDLIIAEVKKLPKKAVVADFGCGEARLAQSVHRATVHSFDLVAANDKVA